MNICQNKKRMTGWIKINEYMPNKERMTGWIKNKWINYKIKKEWQDK